MWSCFSSGRTLHGSLVNILSSELSPKELKISRVSKWSASITFLLYNSCVSLVAPSITHFGVSFCDMHTGETRVFWAFDRRLERPEKNTEIHKYPQICWKKFPWHKNVGEKPRLDVTHPIWLKFLSNRFVSTWFCSSAGSHCNPQHGKQGNPRPAQDYVSSLDSIGII